MGGGDVELCCRPYSAGVLHSVSDQIQNLKIDTPPQTKMTSKDDSKGFVPSFMVLYQSTYVQYICGVYLQTISYIETTETNRTFSKRLTLNFL
jgi:hypothetical protein